MNDDPVWLNLLRAFVPLSFLTIGGGQSIVADIHRQSVGVYGWMTDAQFLDLFALSRLTPGPGSLLVAMIGWKAAGVVGVLVASFAIFVPASLLIYGLARLWGHYRDATWPRAVETGLVPVAAGMVLAGGCTILRAADGGVLAWVAAGVSTAALLFTRINPFIVLGLCGAVYLLASVLPH